MTFAKIVSNIVAFLNNIITVIIGIALVIFLSGLIKYIVGAAEESKRKEAIQYIVFGLFGLFVIVGVWGLVSLLASFIGTEVGIPRF